MRIYCKARKYEISNGLPAQLGHGNCIINLWNHMKL